MKSKTAELDSIKEKYDGKFFKVTYYENSDLAKFIFVKNVHECCTIPGKYMYDGIEINIEFDDRNAVQNSTLKASDSFILNNDGFNLAHQVIYMEEIPEKEFNRMYQATLARCSSKNITINASLTGSVKVVTSFLKEHGYTDYADELKEIIDNINKSSK